MNELIDKVLEPSWHIFNSKRISCPLDLESHGTWIGYNSKIIATLQNGAELKHERNLPYDLSRELF